MKNLMLIMFISAILACSVSPISLRNSTPTLEITSTHNSELISKCIYNMWGNKHNLKSDYKPSMYGHTVSLHINNNLAHLIEISNTLQGSNTIVFSNSDILGKDPSIEKIRACYA